MKKDRVLEVAAGVFIGIASWWFIADVLVPLIIAIPGAIDRAIYNSV